jgi:hypothetical protein
MSRARHLSEIEFALRELVAEFDPYALALCEAPDMFRAADRVERLAASLKVLLARRVEAAGVEADRVPDGGRTVGGRCGYVGVGRAALVGHV